VKNKDYFVITTNVDHQFILASFDKKRLFYTQGDYGLFQCSLPCQNETFDNEEIIKQMVAKQIDGKIPSSLIPRCPFCGRKLTTNLRSDDHFVEDEGWHQALERYQTFIEKNKDKKILFLELGVGWNTPGIIKYPFMQMTKKFKNSFYLCINQGQNYCFDEIQERSLILNEDLNILLEL
jgi:NAD-dependent SIR2 family protein deacetylase